MAVWQVCFSVVPLDGLVAVHGDVPAMLPEFIAPIAEIDASEVVPPNYWEASGRPEARGAFASILPEKESWSATVRVFGSEESNDIQISNEEVLCRIDVRNMGLGLLETIVMRAADLNCCLVVRGRTVPPRMDLVQRELEHSDAYRFWKDPVSTLVALGNRERS